MKKYWVNNYQELYEKSYWEEKRLFIIIDEFQSFKEEISSYLGNTFNEIIEFLIVFCRSFWINIIIVSQNYQSSKIGNIVKNNLIYSFIGKMDTTNFSDLNFNEETKDILNSNLDYI